ncbi:hypothetical protein ACKGJO_06760 [Gracilimonas sp. Q87]|uniref:hypothetical protein n=1 Tax=Gracilimonas sp. Q87 TaxID=3384766 RepID=UPI00398452DE
MGLFSFKTNDTERSIPTTPSDREPFPVTMTDNKGNKWHEPAYYGYGEFGGKDIFELIAEMNGKETRDEGIVLHHSDEKALSPNLTEDPDREWVDEPLTDCPHQGFFYPDE